MYFCSVEGKSIMDSLGFPVHFPITDPTWIFFLVLLIILFAPLLMGKLRIPHIVGMILAGILIGKDGLNILAYDDSFELFGKVGMYYIVFLAGLELDMDDFKKNRSKGIIFGLLTFTFPIGIGLIANHSLLHYGLMSSVLLASIYASNTLITYPIISRYGLSRERSSSISIAGTIVAVLFALIILAVISGTYKSDNHQSSWFWALLLLKVFILTALIFFFMPRLCRWFFRRYDDAVMQFVFVLSMVFLGAALMQIVGMEGILGAFLAGLVLNRFVPHVSPLMNRLEFVGNALFIPYFLIGVGMIIDIKSLFVGGFALYVASVMTIVAMIAKWIPCYITQKIFGLHYVERKILFGMTNAHAAAALATVMVGHGIIMSDGERLLDDNVLNGTIVMILVTCIISSIITERAARQIVTQQQLSGDSVNYEQETFLIPISNPDNIEGLMEMALTLRPPKDKTPLIALSVINDNNASETKEHISKRNLEQAAKLGAAANAMVKTVLRYDMNIAQGIIHTLKEYSATDVVIGLHRKGNLMDSFLGSLTERLLEETQRQVMITKLLIPVNTLRRIVVAVPEKAEYEAGFVKWVAQLCRMARQLGCRIRFFATKRTIVLIQNIVERKDGGQFAEFSELEDWDDLLLLTGQVSYDHLFVVVSSRSGSISYKSSFEKLPQQLGKYFANNSLLIIYPDQFANPQDTVSFANPIVRKPVSITLYDKIVDRFSKLTKKED